MSKKKQPKQPPKYPPLDPAVAAERFMREATHDWRSALRAIVQAAYEAAAKAKDGAA